MKRSVLIAAVAIFLITNCANLQIPLYSTYAQKAGLGSGISAIAFGLYVAGLLPTLILFGGISDHVGRKKIILAGLLFAAIATFLMIAHPTIYTLFMTRILQGIGVGLITGTGTAYISALMPQNPAQVAAYVSLTTALGFSSGALLTNGALLIERSLVPSSYWVSFVLILGCLGLVIGIPEQPTTNTNWVKQWHISYPHNPPMYWGSNLRKRVKLKPNWDKGSLVRLPIFPTGTRCAGFAIALAWSLAGIVGVILPAQLIQYGLPNGSGLMLFIFVITGVLFQPLAKRLDARRSLQLGCVLLVGGYIVFTCGAWLGVLNLVLAGVAIAGIACYGFTYLGGLAEVVRHSGNQSARATSGYFTCAYLGYGIPVVLIGFLAERFGIVNTLFGFGAILLVCNALLIGSIHLGIVLSTHEK